MDKWKGNTTDWRVLQDLHICHSESRRGEESFFVQTERFFIRRGGEDSFEMTILIL
jgi:hypothetical protein